MRRASSLEKTLMLGKTEGRRRRGRQRMRWLYGIINSADMSLSKLRDIVKEREAWYTAVQGFTKNQYNLATEQQWITGDSIIQMPIQIPITHSPELWMSAAAAPQSILPQRTAFHWEEPPGPYTPQGVAGSWWLGDTRLRSPTLSCPGGTALWGCSYSRIPKGSGC